LPTPEKIGRAMLRYQEERRSPLRRRVASMEKKRGKEQKELPRLSLEKKKILFTPEGIKKTLYKETQERLIERFQPKHRPIPSMPQTCKANSLKKIKL
jgi:ADP-heptose:LPS heptosyltransferase